MQLERNSRLGAILGFLGNPHRGLQFDETGVFVLGRRSRKLPWPEIAAPAAIEKGLLLTSISLPLANGSCLRVSGIEAAAGAAFAVELNKFWRTYLQQAIDARRDEISALRQTVERLSNPRRYPAACLLEPYVELAREMFSSIPVSIPEEAIAKEQAQPIELIAGFHRNPSDLRDQAISRFVDSELREMAGFFDRIEANSLTPEQRLAVVTDEDATLVLAGAGSGKTSVIVAKAAYLVERGIRKPGDILLVAFGKGAAAEMAERIKQRCGAPVAARTFHALAYGIIAEVEGEAPALAAHATDEKSFTTLLRKILLDLAEESDELAELLICWFAEFFSPYRSEWDFDTLHGYYRYVKDHEHELRTLQGERVKSFEELKIANWLYLNGIGYDYEPNYEHALPRTGRRAYTPDFRLKESGVYIEHFGVRKERAPNGGERLTTAPIVDRDEYLERMKWKRNVHAEHGTTLIETFSYERVEGRLTQALSEKLAPYVEINPIPAGQVFERLEEMGRIDAFTQTLATFLRHFKGAGLSVEECRTRTAGPDGEERGTAFLKIFEPVFEAYQRQLGQRIDFEDMIARATRHVKSGRYQSPYRHLLVDEFQDISKGRADLLRALKEQHGDARIFAVGDDWQSIYRFTGSDIHLMRDFGQEFGGKFAAQSGIRRTVDLGRTFRSVEAIAIPARDFVLKNPDQIEKEVIPAGTCETPAIRVAWTGKSRDASVLGKLLNEISRQQTASKKKTASVLLLGRYRHSCPANLKILEKNHSGLSICFKTIHASKGLEADHVIVLGADSGRWGLPSEVADDPILGLVLPRPELFPHAEERRVFYVALTRARLSVTVVAATDRPSAFVTELLENRDCGVAEIGGGPASNHRCARCGGRLIVEHPGTRRHRFVCEHKRLCGAYLPACAACGNDLPVRSVADPAFSVCSCGDRRPACPQCTDGWLVERRGRYGNFLGCVKYPRCNGTKRSA